ncbi:MAG: N-acetylneuraminate synthase [Magnetococcales bacterium]|nr:N-acetylneuraminate synthase [Magnetococcales bacterium]
MSHAPPDPPGIYIIAEAGVNHNGQLELACRLVDVAAEAGADAVKFQTFRAGELVSRFAPKADYQKEHTDPTASQLAMIRQLELDADSHVILQARCRERGIDFLSTPFDPGSLAFLVREMRLSTLKISSGEVTNGPLLIQVGASGCRVMLSTGMSTLGEVEQALGALAFGMLDASAPPSPEAFARAYASVVGQARLAERVTLLHCTTEYPAPFAEVNLRAMESLKAAFGLPVGYSDHTPGITIPIAAAARGARVIEKHFTLDRALPGPDHQASLEPEELTRMVEAIRIVEQALGHGRKIPVAAELKNRPIARKSLVALAPIAPGERFTTENLGVKRPGTGLSPMHYWQWLGRRASRAYQMDECLNEDQEETT